MALKRRMRMGATRTMLDPATLYFPTGVAIGVAAAAPVGPINLLVIQRALGRQVAAALTLGFGGALGDAVFAAVAAFGLGAVSLLLAEHGGVIRIVGGLVMLAFAVVVWRATPQLTCPETQTSAARMAAVVFGLTLTNPATLFFFLGSFGAVGFVGIGHDSPAHAVNAGLVVAGVFAGSMLWWLTVSAAARALQRRVTDRHLVILNHVTGVVLALFGIAAIAAGINVIAARS